MLDLVVIGAGPAGLSAGMYATRGGMKNVVVFENRSMGGQITSSSEIENYPGQKEDITGAELMASWPEQCMKFGLKHEIKGVQSVRKTGKFFSIIADGEEYQAKAVILATGSNPRKAGVKGESEYFGRGISTCATCDGFFYKGKEVAVLGGGDTAIEEAMYLARICKKVYLIHRRDEFRAAPVTLQRAKNTENIEFIVDTLVEEILGDVMGVTGLKLKNKKTGQTSELNVPGVFVFVGMIANNEAIKDGDKFICEVNDQGQVLVDLSMKTSLEGLFAAGDIRDKAAKQVVCAAGDGATAALSAMAYIQELD